MRSDFSFLSRIFPTDVYANGLEDAGKSTEEITQTLKDAKILNVETDDSEDKLSQTKDTVTDIANILLAPYTLDLNTTEAMTKLGDVKELMNQISETTITAPVPSVPKSYAERITTGTTGTGSANAAGTNGGLARAERALVGELGYFMMENFNLKCEQLKTYICDGVNQIGLPPYAVELILESLLRDVQNIRKSAIQEEMEAAKKAAAEKVEGAPVDAAEDKPEE